MGRGLVACPSPVSPASLPAAAPHPLLKAPGLGVLRAALAAGGGGDGAVQVGQAAGRRVHAHRDREAEDELRGGGRGGLAPLPQGPGRAGGLRGAGRGQHLRLELQQLPHEAEVGRDDAPPLLDELEGLLQPHALLHHQVGQADGGGARDAGLAVHQHAPAALLHRIWGRERDTIRDLLRRKLQSRPKHQGKWSKPELAGAGMGEGGRTGEVLEGGHSH